MAGTKPTNAEVSTTRAGDRPTTGSKRGSPETIAREGSNLLPLADSTLFMPPATVEAMERAKAVVYPPPPLTLEAFVHELGEEEGRRVFAELCVEGGHGDPRYDGWGLFSNGISPHQEARVADSWASFKALRKK